MSVLDDYAREIRAAGECHLLVQGDERRIVASRGIAVNGTGGFTIGSERLREDAVLLRLHRPSKVSPVFSSPAPDATDAEIERWFVDDLLAASVDYRLDAA